MRWGFVTLLVLLAACSSTSEYAIEQDVKAGNIEGAAQKLEQRRDANPDDLETRLVLADAYYQLARKSLDAGNQAGYVDYLGKAQAEILEAARIDPTSPRPHTWLGIITAYQGDMTAAETSFRNALRLNLKQRWELRQGTYYSNLAHIAVYRGKLADARGYLDKGIKNGAPQDEVDRIEVLAAWKANDLVEARDIFNSAVELSPAFAATWDGAPLPAPMKSFDDFAATCCANPTCGPHMEGACKRAKHDVARRQLDIDTQAEERALEVERQKTLREIYQRRKDVQISVEGDEKPANGAPAPKPAPAPKK